MVALQKQEWVLQRLTFHFLHFGVILILKMKRLFLLCKTFMGVGGWITTSLSFKEALQLSPQHLDVDFQQVSLIFF